jgi:hypothetical protein
MRRGGGGWPRGKGKVASCWPRGKVLAAGRDETQDTRQVQAERCKPRYSKMVAGRELQAEGQTAGRELQAEGA